MTNNTTMNNPSLAGLSVGWIPRNDITVLKGTFVFLVDSVRFEACVVIILIHHFLGLQR